MKKFLLLFVLLCLAAPVSAKYYGFDPLRGYLLDMTGQIEEYERIAPPHEDKIPPPRYVKTITPTKLYYDINHNGLRRPYNKVPYIPGYNVHYKESRAVPYTKDEYVDVWCSGKAHVNGVDCVTDNYAITFTDVRFWSYGVTKAVWKAKKVGKRAAVFCYVNNIGLDSTYIEQAKKWGDIYNIPVFFGTIDAYLKL